MSNIDYAALVEWARNTYKDHELVNVLATAIESLTQPGGREKP